VAARRFAVELKARLAHHACRGLFSSANDKSLFPNRAALKKFMSKKVKKVGILTAGGLAPCLSASIGYLIEAYTRVAPKVEIICYVNGYMGLLQGKSLKVTPNVRKHWQALVEHGGSPIGNSRVKLTNVKDCVKRGLVKEGQDPQKVAADQLIKDGVDVLHTIGGDDTNTAAADLAKFLKTNNYELTVVGMPKTIDNDVVPIHQSLGAWTAAEEGAHYFANVVAEHNANPRMLIIHEVMGRNCGWLTAATAEEIHGHDELFARPRLERGTPRCARHLHSRDGAGHQRRGRTLAQNHGQA
jgi:6-phosphofructokinase